MASRGVRFLSEADRLRLLKEIDEEQPSQPAEGEKVIATSSSSADDGSRRQTGRTRSATAAKKEEATGGTTQKNEGEDDDDNLSDPTTLRRHGDGLEELVSALPDAYSSRFGEICWAQGGGGYGWWPSCIYDPRFTAGTTRTQARRMLGRKHLVYFFQCDVTASPFDLLSEDKILSWTDGLSHGLHLGRTAKSAGRARFRRFQEALQAAIVEEGKPQSRRLEWNHREGRGSHGMANLLPSPIQLVIASARKSKSRERKRKRKMKEKGQDGQREQRRSGRSGPPARRGRLERTRARRAISFGDAGTGRE